VICVTEAPAKTVVSTVIQSAVDAIEQTIVPHHNVVSDLILYLHIVYTPCA